jgi:hypothetical protein
MEQKNETDRIIQYRLKYFSYLGFLQGNTGLRDGPRRWPLLDFYNQSRLRFQPLGSRHSWHQRLGSERTINPVLLQWRNYHGLRPGDPGGPNPSGPNGGPHAQVVDKNTGQGL